MKPRYAADYRTILWLFFAMVTAVAIWMFPQARAYLVPLQCYWALCAGIIAHNHNHCPTFKSRTGNDMLNYVATAFYGFAAFNWIPTHNLNHHKFQNAPGDATITWRTSRKHNALVAFTYPFVSMAMQVPLIDAYVKESRTKRPAQYRNIMIQLVICWGLPIALTLVDWRATVAAIWIPRLFSVYAIIYFNYGQHVHCDPYSEWNHSRNFTGRVLNFLLFNNGLHTVHHRKAGSHWSLAYKLHAEIEANIDPSLNQANLAKWMINSYVLSLFSAKFGTHQVGRAPYDPPSEDAHIPAGELEVA